MNLVPPLSKSDAQRALVLADILGVPFSEVLPAGEALPRDVEVLRDGLLALKNPTARIDCLTEARRSASCSPRRRCSPAVGWSSSVPRVSVSARTRRYLLRCGRFPGSCSPRELPGR